MNNSLIDSPLGEASEFPRAYTPSLLHPIARKDTRFDLLFEHLSETDDQLSLPFKGVDIWNAYELSWLDDKGKPQCALAEFQFPCTSKAIVESKSFKLYLGSLNGTRFNSILDVRQTLEADLSVTVGSPVEVKLLGLDKQRNAVIGTMPGESLDELAIEVSHYQREPMLLVIQRGQAVTESLHTHLFRSLCPVTGQPDWASVGIQYTGQPIERESLLKYLISYREHAAFHEDCVEQIYMDIWQQSRPQRLTVFARFLRRGGLDINPVRSSDGQIPETARLIRQ